MAFDACFLGAVLTEIREKALGGRIEKIHQPARDSILVQLRCDSGRYKLLFGISPASPRLYLTEASPENPAQPPMFCMFLRKHLSGGRLIKISQLPMERVAEFTFSCISELGDPVQRRLVAELMGRTCNLYLLDETGRILDCLRRIGFDETAKRPALPGLYYQSPEPVEKLDPAKMTLSDWEALCAQPGPDLLSERLMEKVGGLSMLVCREAALAAGGDTDARMESLQNAPEKLYAFFRTHLENPGPYYYADDRGNWKQFAFCPIYQYGNCQRAEDFTALLDGFYVVKDRKDAMHQKSQAVRKTVSNLCQRISRKLAIQEKELEATYDRERLRQFGDIVTANLHRIQKGQPVLQAEDFYDENMAMVEIPLSVTLSPQQNAAKYYKDYARMKNAEKELKNQLSLGQVELSYLKSVLEELDRADTEADLEEIRRELQEGGYLKRDNSQKRMKTAKSQPMRFESTDGYPIYVGRNNHQNEELTFRLARKDDLWLHAQKVHGSHVIIACAGKQPPDNTITQAAQLAAHYAETAGGQNVAVDVTPVKQVKKTPAGKPGMVIYHTYKTVIVNPYPDIRLDPLNAE